MYSSGIFLKKVVDFYKLTCYYQFRAREQQHMKAQIAQSVEQRTENPCVAGSIPALGTV